LLYSQLSSKFTIIWINFLQLQKQNVRHLCPASSYAYFLLRHVRYLGLSEDVSKDCEICWDTYSKDDPAVQIPNLLGCNHVFGRKCLGLWLHNNNTCPKCRIELYSGPTPADSLKISRSMYHSYQDVDDIISPYGDRDDVFEPVNIHSTYPNLKPSVARLEQMLPTNRATASSLTIDWEVSQMLQDSGSNDIFHYQMHQQQGFPTSNLRNTPNPISSGPIAPLTALAMPRHQISYLRNRPRSNAMQDVRSMRQDYNQRRLKAPRSIERQMMIEAAEIEDDVPASGSSLAVEQAGIESLSNETGPESGRKTGPSGVA
jgi:hypothetical protein